ncbi:MAG TPA: peptidoglycan-binding domain-containing protein [Tabrizicola sp.]|nr:peptidoglycan-binding domain-containing protein [Tabrizicola sp.]
MLPIVTTAKSSFFAALTAVSIAALPAAPAHALGDKEKTFLLGVVTALVVDGIIDNNKKSKVVAPSPPPVYVDPTPTYTTLSATPAARAFNTYTKAERKAIQHRLKAWGYYSGGIDGSFGRGTYNAVVAYAKDEGVTNSLKSTTGAFGLYDGLLY